MSRVPVDRRTDRTKGRGTPFTPEREEEGGMTIDPTPKEWLAACERVRKLRENWSLGEALIGQAVEAALGCPCPPEPPPESWQLGGMSSLTVEVAAPSTDVRVTFGNVMGAQLTAYEADAMAAALIEHARYAREQRDDGPICGGLRRRDISEPLCLRPKGHAGACGAVSA